MQVGINEKGQKDSFRQATQGMANDVFTMNTYTRDVEYNELTTPFVSPYVQKFGETPTYTADTYAAIKYTPVPAIERVGSLDPDKLVAFMENDEHKVPSGLVGFMKGKQGRPLHDLK